MTLTLRLERLENRAVAAQVTVAPGVVAWAAGHLGERIGGGECVHLVTEALRASGDRFAWLVGAVSLDYRWGQGVGIVRAGGDIPVCRPGDVLQFWRATFSDGSWATHHTSIVETVDASGHPLTVLQQNWDGVRSVTRESIDLAALTAGRVSVYRPLPRTPVSGIYQFTVTNRGSVAIRVVEQTAGGQTAYRLDPGAYRVRVWQAASVPVLLVGAARLPVHDAAAYEVGIGSVTEIF